MTVPDPWIEAAALRSHALKLDETAAMLRIHARNLEHMALVGVRRVRMAGAGPARTGTVVELELEEEGVALVEWDDRPSKGPRPVAHRHLRPVKARTPESEISIFKPEPS